MKVSEHLKVTPEEFFAVVDEALLADIASARDKKAKASHLHEGYTYKKYLRGKADAAHAATVRIVSYDRPRSYRSTVTTQQGVTTMGYDVEPAGDGIDVTYVEEFRGTGGFKAILSNMVAPLQSLNGSSRIKSQLKAIEGRILADAYPEPEADDAAKDA